MAWLEQFVDPAEIAKMSDTQVENMTARALFILDRQAVDNPQLKKALETQLQPAAKRVLQHP
jgi:hypothetical protein